MPTYYITEANQDNYQAGRSARVWGLNAGPKNLATWEKLRPGDVVIFIVDRVLTATATVTEKLDNAGLAQTTFGTDTYGGIWRLMFRTSAHRPIVADADLARVFGGRIPGFRRVRDDILKDVQTLLGDRFADTFGPAK